MSTSIRISDETKQKLEAIKRDDETFDELLARLTRTERDVTELGGFADDDVVEGMARTRDETRDDFEDRLNSRCSAWTTTCSAGTRRDGPTRK